MFNSADLFEVTERGLRSMALDRFEAGISEEALADVIAKVKQPVAKK